MDIDTVYVYVPAEELSKKSYRKWRTRTQTLLDAADLLGVVTDTAALTDKNAPTESDHEIWTKDRKAFNIIMGQLHHRDSDMVISNPALQNSARTLWVHLYRRYGDVNPLQVNKAWCQFYKCGMDLKTPNLLVNLSAAITQLEAAGQATDIVQCRMFVLSMFPSSHQPLKERLINEEPSPTLDQVLSHLKTAIDSCREPVSSVVGSGNPALEEVDNFARAENTLSNCSTTLKQCHSNHQPSLSSSIDFFPPTSLFFNPWVNVKSESSALNPKRDPQAPTASRSTSKSFGSSQTCQIPTLGSCNAVNEKTPSDASLVSNQAANQVPHDGAQTRPNSSPLQSAHWFSPFDVPRESKSVETCRFSQTPREGANVPDISPQESSSSMSGLSTAKIPRESYATVDCSSNIFDTQKDVKPDIPRDVKPNIPKIVGNRIQKEIKPDIKKELESDFNNEGTSRVDHVYEEQVTSSCAAQNPATRAHLRPKLEQKPMSSHPTTRTSDIPQPMRASPSHERQLVRVRASQEDPKPLQRRTQEKLDRLEAHARQKANRVQEYHSPSAPHMKPGTMEYMRYILQNHLPRLVIYWDLRKPDLLYLFRKYHIDRKPVDDEELARYHSFYNRCKPGEVPGSQRQRDPWRAAIQLLNPSRVLPAKMTIDQLQRAFYEEGGRR